MKKNFKKNLLFALIGLSLVACSSNKTIEKNDYSKEKKEQKKSDNKKVKEEKKQKTKEETTEENRMKKTVIFTNKELNKNGNLGPIKYNFSKIQISKLEALTDDAAKMLQVDKNKEFTLIVLDVEAENTSTSDVSCYISQTKLVSNTKEQIDPHMFLSKHIDGDFLGNVKKTGNNVYLLKNSKAEDIKSIKLVIPAVHDKNFKNLSEKAEITIDLK